MCVLGNSSVWLSYNIFYGMKTINPKCETKKEKRKESESERVKKYLEWKQEQKKNSILKWSQIRYYKSADFIGSENLCNSLNSLSV